MSDPVEPDTGSPEASRVRRDLPPPWLPEGSIVRVPDRGEFFIRRHQHPDPSAPTVMLLHGWTATSDLQFLGAYRELAQVCSFVAIDHRGHGRGLRTLEPYQLFDVADDAAAVARELGIDQLIALGYSMGGPIAMYLARRHPDLVAGIVVQATALEWRATRRERLQWKLLPLFGAAIRSWAMRHLMLRVVERMLSDKAEFASYREWLTAEAMRNDPHTVIGAGRALSRHDARLWVDELDLPAGSLITTRDRMVKPSKQRQLAAALNADVVELDIDHLDALDTRNGFGSATADLVQRVSAAISAAGISSDVPASR